MASTPPADGAPLAVPPASGMETLAGGTQRYTPPTQQTGAEAPAAPATPTLPEGYADWAAYGQAVAEGKVTPPAAATTEEPAKAPDGPVIPPEVAAKFEPFNAEFTETGTLSAESVTKAAADFGVTEDMVRQYLAGATAEGASSAAPFLEQAGGAEGYAEFQAWSAQGMTEAEQKSLNEAYKGNNPAAALALQQKFVDQWKAEGNGPAPRDLTAQNRSPSSSENQGYASLAEQKRDQADPRYKSDEAFRNKVINRIDKSTF